MIRKIIVIDENKCNGCGLCAEACHEGAIGIKDGKAVLLREDYCDGLGDCLPACPMDAISFEEREAAAYDHIAVQKHLSDTGRKTSAPACLANWPVQIKLLAPNVPWLNDCDLLIAADCTAYAYGNFHEDFIKGRAVIIGCPKLDAIDYSEKLSAIFKENNIKSITLTRMTVPCCGGMQMAINKAIAASGKNIPFRTVVISPDGTITNIG